MSIAFLETILFSVDTLQNRDELLDELSYFCDEDFNGNNGKEYNWELTNAGGYRCNQAYVIDTIKKADLINEFAVIDKYFEMWLGFDSYYEEYRVQYGKQGDMFYISVTATHED